MNAKNYRQRLHVHTPQLGARSAISTVQAKWEETPPTTSAPVSSGEGAGRYSSPVIRSHATP